MPLLLLLGRCTCHVPRRLETLGPKTTNPSQQTGDVFDRPSIAGLSSDFCFGYYSGHWSTMKYEAVRCLFAMQAWMTFQPSPRFITMLCKTRRQSGTTSLST